MKGWPRVRLAAGLMVAFCWYGMAEGGVPQTQATWECSRILAASAETKGIGLILLERCRGLERERFRFMRVDFRGKVLEEAVRQIDNDLPTPYWAIPYKGGLSLAWSENGKLRLETMRNGAVQTQTLLSLPETKDGTPDKICVVDVGGKQELLMVVRRYVNAEGKSEWFEREYEWIYRYSLEKDLPVLTGKICVEDDENPVSETICVSKGGALVIWQRYHMRVRSANEAVRLAPDCIRHAEWGRGSEIKWTEHYAGVSPLMLFADPSNGSVCLVQECKGQQDQSGIYCLLPDDATSIIPIGGWTGWMPEVLFRRVRLRGRDLWVLVERTKAGIVVRYLSKDFSPVKVETTPVKGLSGTALAVGTERAWIVGIQADSITVDEIPHARD